MGRIHARRAAPSAAAIAAGLFLAFGAAACGGSGPTVDPAAPKGRVEAAAQIGRFQLTFAVDRGVVRADEAITGEAALHLVVPGGATITGSGSLFTFDFLEVEGEGRHVAPIRDGACGPHRVTSDAPSVSPIVKSGAAEGPNAAWLADFLRGTTVKLPRGTWDITAIASFHDAQACAGQELTLNATVRIHVSG
jgi:hypothetical protein